MGTIVCPQQTDRASRKTKRIERHCFFLITLLPGKKRNIEEILASRAQSDSIQTLPPR